MAYLRQRSIAGFREAPPNTRGTPAAHFVRRLHLSTLLVVPVLMLLVPAVASSQTPLDNSDFVVAGLSLGSDSSRVIALLGRPNSVTTEPDPIEANALIHDWHYSGLVLVFYSPEALSAFVLLTSARSTHRGLRVGDTAEGVRRLYGRPTRIDRIPDVPVSEHWTYEDPSESLRLIEVRIQGGRVVQIFVGTARD